MSVTAQTPYKKYVAAPGATFFTTDFRLLLATDLQVKVNSVVVTSGFTLGVLGGPSTDLTFGTPMVGGEIVELQRKVPKTRATDYQQLGDYQASQVNADFDRIVMMLQDSQFLNDLAVLLPVGDAAAPMTLPALADRALKFLAFDALGKAIAAPGVTGSPVSTFMASVILSANAAAARAAIGAGTGDAQAGVNTNITSLGNNTSTVYTTAGTSTAYTITPNPAITAYAVGQSFVVNFNAASGASPTLQINGIATPPNLVKQDLSGTFSNIAAGDIPANHRSRVTLISTTQALVERLPVVLNIGAAVATTSGTVATQTGIPSSAKRITMNLLNCGTNGTSNKVIQLGSGSLKTSGYTQTQAFVANGSNGLGANATGFTIASSAAADRIYGTLVFTLADAATNTWNCSGKTQVATAVFETVGSVSLSGALDRIGFTSATPDTLVSGSYSLIVEG
jgi:hypothetical protein